MHAFASVQWAALEFFQSLSCSMQNSVKAHEAKVASMTDRSSDAGSYLCNIMQTPGHTPPHRMAPALLRRSHVWSTRHQRLATPAEHFEIMGYNMYGPKLCPFAGAVAELGTRHKKSLAGNGMHAIALGAVLLFLFAVTIVDDDLATEA